MPWIWTLVARRPLGGHGGRRGLIDSFGEEGMQLVQLVNHRIFSVLLLIFRTRSIGSIGTHARTGFMLLFLVNFDDRTVTMGVACPLLRRKL